MNYSEKLGLILFSESLSASSLGQWVVITFDRPMGDSLWNTCLGTNIKAKATVNNAANVDSKYRPPSS